MDEAKVFSYLAQIEGGLRLLGQKVESALDISSTESGGDKKSGQHNFEGAISPTVAATAQILSGLFTGVGVPLGLMAGAGGKYAYQRNWEQGTDILKTESSEGATSSELNMLHHAAFDLVMQRLNSKFVSITGKVSLLPMSMLEGVIEISSGGSLDANAMQGMKFLRLMEVRNLIYVEGGQSCHGFLADEHFTVPPHQFTGVYGSPSEQSFTIVGFHAQVPGNASRRKSPRQVAGSDSKALFESLNDMSDAVTTLFGLKDSKRIYPIAIYRDL